MDESCSPPSCEAGAGLAQPAPAGPFIDLDRIQARLERRWRCRVMVGVTIGPTGRWRVWAQSEHGRFVLIPRRRRMRWPPRLKSLIYRAAFFLRSISLLDRRGMERISIFLDRH